MACYFNCNHIQSIKYIMKVKSHFILVNHEMIVGKNLPNSLDNNKPFEMLILLQQIMIMVLNRKENVHSILFS